VVTIFAIDVLYAQLTSDLFATANFLYGVIPATFGFRTPKVTTMLKVCMAFSLP